jgi:hypothetical protein
MIRSPQSFAGINGDELWKVFGIRIVRQGARGAAEIIAIELINDPTFLHENFIGYPAI